MIRTARRALVLFSLTVLSPVAVPTVARAQGMSQDEALRLAFPGEGVEIERRTAYLTEDELTELRELAGEAAESSPSVVTYYLGRRDGTPLGVAYFDTHRVRMLRQVLMLVVGPDDRLRGVHTVAFGEPPEYTAPTGWLEQFRDRGLSDALSLKGEIAAITGATLTARAVTGASRRVLALHAIIAPFETAENRRLGAGGGASGS